MLPDIFSPASFYFAQIYVHVQHSFCITGLFLYETDCHTQLCYCFIWIFLTVRSIGDLLTGSYEGKSVKVNGAVHTIRDMGEVAFIVLRKREGLLQCVYEEGKTQFDLKDLKEAATIEVEGTVKPEERAPHGFEIDRRGGGHEPEHGVSDRFRT